MGIIYVLSLILILLVFMLVKKSDQKLNVLGILGLGIVLILCYNVFQCYVLNYFEIKLSLQNLSKINFVIGISGIIYLLNKKEVQKYSLSLRDLIYSVIIGLIVIIISGLQYGSSLDIKYETTDAAVHYRAAQLFAENESLLNNVKDEIYNFRSFKIGSYVNSGLMMQVASDYVDEYYYYKIFIIFDLFILFLTAYMLYFTFVKISKGKLKLLALAMSLLCVLGYPLNSMLWGFEYLNIGILLVCVILNMVSYYKNKEIGFKQSVLIFFLLNFELFCAYYMFVPFMYSALFIYFCIHHYRNSRKLVSKKLIIILLVTLIIPFILGYIYHLKPEYYSEQKVVYIRGEYLTYDDKVTVTQESLAIDSSNTEKNNTKIEENTEQKDNGKEVNMQKDNSQEDNIPKNTTQEINDINKNVLAGNDTNVTRSPVASIVGLTSEGYIYKNLYSNLLLLLPLTIFVLFRERKEFNFSTIVLIFLVGFISVLFIGAFMGYVSQYYIAKNYFALWIVLWYFNFKGLYLLSKENKIVMYVLCLLYVLFMVISFNRFNMDEVKNTFRNVTNLTLSEVYNINQQVFTDTDIDIYTSEADLLKYAKHNLNKDKKVEILGTQQQILWSYPLLDRVTYQIEMDDLSHQEKLKYKHGNNEIIEEADYVICFYRSDFYKEYDKNLLDNKKIIYENDFGKIIKNK